MGGFRTELAQGVDYGIFYLHSNMGGFRTRWRVNLCCEEGIYIPIWVDLELNIFLLALIFGIFTFQYGWI